MKQVVQNYKNGDLWLEDVPTPICRPGTVLVRNEYSVVSTGTERMKVSQARMSLLEKARARPDKVKQVLTNITQFGIVETYRKVQERLDSLTPLGYSSAGTVIATGEGCDSLSIGDRVACAGEGIACHAEFVVVPRNLCAKIPDTVDSKDAAFSTVGAIAMNGVRQANVSIGDTVLVIGLGLVGLLGVQLLKASGCRVLGTDLDASKLALATECGAEAVFQAGEDGINETIDALTNGRGVDVVYIAASTNRTDPMDLAGEVCRDRGTVVVVGMIPVHAEWQVYYDKELNVVMARSYGPGRYDRNYEEKGIDYPVGYVPWTERRNLEEFMRLIEVGSVSPTMLQPQQFEFAEAPEAYKQVHENPGKHAIGIVFKYDEKSVATNTIVAKKEFTPVQGSVTTALIGAGNFATGTLIPAIKSVNDVTLHTICSARGLNAKSTANRHGFQYASSDATAVFANPEVDSVVIATRHDTHAAFAIDALNNGKHVFVEKPLALNEADLQLISEAQQKSGKILQPGFNRRFSPLSQSVRDFFREDGGPLEVICRVNAGALAADSWYQDSDEGGWRIVSEGCHFIDLISYLVRSQPKSVYASIVNGGAEGQQNDNCMVNLVYENGSIATLAYLANGDPGYEKEKIEVFGQSRTASINNWRSASLSYGGRTNQVRASGKGHKDEIASFYGAIKTGIPAIEPADAIKTTLTTFKILESIQSGGVVSISS